MKPVLKQCAVVLMLTALIVVANFLWSQENTRTRPSPSNLDLSTFVEFVSNMPWILFLPITFIIVARHCEPDLKARVALYGQILEALSLPYMVTGIAVSCIIINSAGADVYWMGITASQSQTGGVIVGLAIPGGLALALGYLITRHIGYCRLSKPLGRRAAYFIIFGIWSFQITIWIGSNLSAFFVGYDAWFLVFVPISFITAFAIHRLSPRPVSLTLADLSILNAIVFVAVALTYWLWGATVDRLDFSGVVNLGSVGLIIGCSIYHAAYLWSLTETPAVTIEVRTKNWHFLEIFSFFFFFLFAPESISGMVNRVQKDETISRLLIELRAQSNKTVIAVGNMSVRQTNNYSGIICSDVTNKGLHVATDVTVEFNYDFASNCDIQEDSAQIYIPMSTGSLERLEVGETQTVCSKYTTLYRDNNAPVKSPAPCDPLNLLGNVKYVVSYSQDPIPRYDYQGSVYERDIKKPDIE